MLQNLKSKHLKENNKNKQAKSYPPVPHATRWRDTKNRVLLQNAIYKKAQREKKQKGKLRHPTKGSRIENVRGLLHGHPIIPIIPLAALKQRCFHAERLMHMWRLEMASGARLALQRWPFCRVFSHPNHEISMVMYICHHQILENKKKLCFWTYWIW